MSEDTATCGFCGARVPLSMIAAHVTEHDLSLTAEDIQNAPIVDATDPREDEVDG